MSGKFTQPKFAFGPDRPLLALNGSVTDLEGDNATAAGPFEVAQLDVQFEMLRVPPPPILPRPAPAPPPPPPGVPMNAPLAAGAPNDTVTVINAFLNATGELCAAFVESF